jgi:hypothetical protein
MAMNLNGSWLPGLIAIARSTEDEAVVGSALSQLGGLGCFEIVPLPHLDGLGIHPGLAAWMVPHPDGPVCTRPYTLPQAQGRPRLSGQHNMQSV